MTKSAAMAYVVNGGVRIHYQVVGVGPPLVLQHGLSDSVASWHEFGYVDGFASGRTLILVDARGHGQSDKPHDPDLYSPAELVADVLAVLDELGVERTAFYGHSMGGRIAFHLARSAPDRLSALIVSAAHPYPSSPDRTQRFLSLLRQGPEAFLGAWEQLGTISPSLRQRILANDLEALIALEMKVAQEAEESGEAAAPAPCPLVMLAGELDWNFDEMSAYARCSPNHSLVALPGLNHLESFVRSDVTLPLVRGFLDSTAP